MNKLQTFYFYSLVSLGPQGREILIQRIFEIIAFLVWKILYLLNLNLDFSFLSRALAKPLNV